jgi:hypothetical protein
MGFHYADSSLSLTRFSTMTAVMLLEHFHFALSMVGQFTIILEKSVRHYAGNFPLRDPSDYHATG